MTSARPANAARDIVGLCGSLRAGSLNHAALRLAGECMPLNFRLEVLDWRQVPPFDADLLSAQGMPAPVELLRRRIQRADGLVIATPEYNFSIPGMLKNVLDWLSRGDEPPLAGKPIALLSASTGPLGGARVQYDLRRVLLCMNAMVLAKPEVFIGSAREKFASAGECTDGPTREFVTALAMALSRWISQTESMSCG